MAASPAPRPLTHVHVVVPAKDEEALLPRALDSLDAAVAELALVRPDLSAVVTVVLDACTDGSARAVAAHPAVQAVSLDVRCVGAARAHGVTRATGGVADEAADRHWLATTDADGMVPGDWLVRQVVLADSGVDLVAGTVEPDPADLDPATLARWRSLHLLRDGHPHVFGANLGVRLSAYRRAGGFDAVALHEDVGLVERVRATGATFVASAAVHVRTSGRSRGRAPGGFADYLGALASGPSLTG